jgi:hypothetical protein
LDQWVKNQEQRRAWLAARGIQYLLVVVPSKQTVYPQYLPDGLAKIHDESHFDEILDRFRQSGSKVKLIDVCAPILAARSADRLYHKTDSHWNDLGAYIGYRTILDAVNQALPEKQVVPHGPGDFDRQEAWTTGGNLASLMNLEDVFEEFRISLIPRYPVPALVTIDGTTLAANVNDPRLPRLVMFRDSFAVALLPMLTPHFSRSVFRWTDELDPGLIEREKPDLVISEFLERRFDLLFTPDDPPEIQEAK